jgi:hypothetical protein
VKPTDEDEASSVPPAGRDEPGAIAPGRRWDAFRAIDLKVFDELT